MKRIESAIQNIRSGYILYGIEELNKCANENDVIAQYFLGRCYERGLGVEKDNNKAFKLYRKCAERGLKDAMYYLALCYKNGIGVNCNNSRFTEWMTRYENKQGKTLEPDISIYFEEGMSSIENYALIPNSDLNQINRDINQTKIINNVTVIQNVAKNNYSNPTPLPQKTENNISNTTSSDVDLDIPTTKRKYDNKFALIIANEDYQVVSGVPHALHDGEIFSEYCQKTLGIPQTNIHFLKNATLNNIKYEITTFKKIAEAYKGDASFIIYYHYCPLKMDGVKN